MIRSSLAPFAATCIALAALAATASPSRSGEAKDAKASAASMDKAAPAAAAGQTAQDSVEGEANVGEAAPRFVLTDLDGVTHKLADYKGKIVVLEWFNPDCPFVKKHHINNKSMTAALESVKGDDLVWFAINSGAPGKQGAGRDRNLKAREEFAMPYPILLDETGVVGKAYGAKNTPHMFVIDAEGKLVYAGAIDDNPAPDVLGQTNHVVETVKQIRAKQPVAVSRTQPYGCSVKYAS